LQWKLLYQEIHALVRNYYEFLDLVDLGDVALSVETVISRDTRTRQKYYEFLVLVDLGDVALSVETVMSRHTHIA